MRFTLLLCLVLPLPALGQAQNTPAAPTAPPAEAPGDETPTPPAVAPADPPADNEAVSETPPAPAEAPSTVKREPTAQQAPSDGAEGDAASSDHEGPAAGEAGDAPAVAPAEATAATRLLVLDVVDKGVGEELAAKMTQELAEQANKSFVGEVMSRAKLKETLDEAALAAIEGCDAEGCMVDLGTKVDASRVVAGTASLSSADVLLSILVLETSTGKLIASEQRKVPNDPELISYATRNLTSIALSGRAADARVPVRISVDAAEPGTRLVIDGTDQGEAPQTVLLLPGPHKLVATLPGYEPTTQTFTVEEATPICLEVSLYWERFPLWPVAATLGVASAATMLVGASLFMVGLYNYNGVYQLLGKDHSYLYHSPATSSTLAISAQNVILWMWLGDAVFAAGVMVGLAALAFEVGDLSLLAFQMSQDRGSPSEE